MKQRFPPEPVDAGPWLGAVADDLTGACDLAGTVAAYGFATVVVLGRPRDAEEVANCECVVVALKSRTAPVAAAVADSLGAARWLLDRGAQRIYQKYCSTFDSTATGNIGPVADALLDLIGRSGTAVSVGTPATPSVARTQYQGHLFVADRLLSESSLRDHPLTPMRDPDLVRLLARQTRRPVGLIPWSTVTQGPDALRAAVRTASAEGAGHLLVDALTDADLDVVAAALPDDDPAADDRDGMHRAGGPVAAVVGGAAGLAGALAREVLRTVRPGARSAGRKRRSQLPHVATGRRLIVSGSCARRTRGQIDAFDGPRTRIDALELADDRDGVLARALAAIAAAYREDAERPALISATAEPAELATVTGALGRERAAELVEHALAELAARAVAELGVRRLIVAGGETSGAVSAALGVRRLYVGKLAAPGVPWTVTVEHPHLALLLKSGNFGGPDLFSTAWQTSP